MMMKKPLAILFLTILLLQMVLMAQALEIERPSEVVKIKRRVQNAYTNNEASVGIGVYVDQYSTEFSDYGGRDCINMNVSMITNSRMGASYTSSVPESLQWYEEGILQYRNTYSNVGDDCGFWVELPSPFRFRFYSTEYRSEDYCEVWVCTNGFISFDPSEPTSAYPSTIPSPEQPNALIAALWTDLVIDDQASIITGLSPSLDYFVVIWKDALRKGSELRLTFQIALEGFHEFDRTPRSCCEGSIRLSYQSVSPITTNFTYGIENLEGCRGCGEMLSGENLSSFDQTTRTLRNNANSNFFIEYLTLEFTDSNWENARYYFPDVIHNIRGNNIRTKAEPPPQTDETSGFIRALGGTATLLAGKGGIVIAGYTVPVWPVSVALITMTWLDVLARFQYNNVQWIELLDSWNGTGIQKAYINVTAFEQRATSLVTDATLCTVFHWVLDDELEGHSLTITAREQYYKCDRTTGQITHKEITTSVNIGIHPDDNNSFETADTVDYGSYGIDPMLWLGGYDLDDYYYIWAWEGSSTVIEMFPPDADFDLFLYDCLLNNVTSSENRGDAMESIGFVANYSGVYYIKVHRIAGFGFYNMTISHGAALSILAGDGGTTDPLPGTYIYKLEDSKEVTVNATPNEGFIFAVWNLDGHCWAQNPITVTMNSDHTLKAYFNNETGGGGGSEPCPTLFVWNGSAWIDYGVIDIHNPTGEEVIREVPVQTEDVGISNYKATFRLREGWLGLNFSESVIDQVKLYAINEDGKLKLCPLTSAEHSRFGDVREYVASSDDVKVEMFLLETIDLTFKVPEDSQGFVFVIEGCNIIKL